MSKSITTVITITTDYPNSDGRACTEAEHLHAYFSRKPKHSCHTTVASVKSDSPHPNILFNENHRGESK